MKDYNADERVHGILVQLPLPSHLNEQTVLDAIDFEKDVDGFHPMNIGLLALKGRSPLFVSCTPQVRRSHTNDQKDDAWRRAWNSWIDTILRLQEKELS